MNQNSPTCLSTHLDRQLSVCLPSICQSIIYYLPNLFIIYLAIYLTSTHLSIHQSCHLMYHLSVLSIICLFIDHLIYLSIYLSFICHLFIYQWWVTKGDFALPPGDIWQCPGTFLVGGEGAPGTWWVETREVAPQPAGPSTPHIWESLQPQMSVVLRWRKPPT